MFLLSFLLVLKMVEGSQYHNLGSGVGYHHVMSPTPSLSTNGNNNGNSMGYHNSDARNYGNAPTFLYASTPNGRHDYREFNSFQNKAAPQTLFAKNFRQEKTTYTNDDRQSLADSNYRYNNEVQGRSGNFNFPPSAPAFPGSYRNYGAYRSTYRPAGFYGNKTPPGFNSPQNMAQDLRGSQIYGGPRMIKNNAKKSGIYVIPTPSKLYFDGIKN